MMPKQKQDMSILLVEGDKRKFFQRQSDREAGVFSSRKPRNIPEWRGEKKPQPQSKPFVSLNAGSYKNEPQVYVTFGFPSTQRTEKTQDEAPAASEKPAMKEQVKPEESVSCVTENFQAFVTQLRDTMMDTEESLREMVELIFERAMQRPNSAGLFAEMCQLLSTVNVPSDSVSFRSLLVKHCQAEYRKSFVMGDVSQKKGSFLEPVRDVRVLDRLREERNNASPSPRSLNTIRFLGELFKSKVLGEKVMHSCIKRLLQNGDGPSLESLCELLRLIQQDLEVVTSREVMDSYCHQLEFIAQEGKRAPRLSLLLKDTVKAMKRAGSARH